MIGRRLLHFQIIEKLGEGGMGVVYKAVDTHLNRFVALKVLPAGQVADPNRKRRFVQEAKAASALSHPNIVQVFDIDCVDGINFIAMEYVAGKTLDQRIPRNGMQLKEALRYSVQIAAALDRAHQAGIVHRDLKPGNIIVDEGGLVKLVDFGLAKLTDKLPLSDATTLTQTAPESKELEPRTMEGVLVGTVAYMSPEQAEGKPVDARSDIFSFGAVLYEMFTGRPAFQGDSVGSTLAAILRDEPKLPSQIALGLPVEVERVIRLCLRKCPGQRFQHMDDVKVELEELIEESDSGTLQLWGHGPKAVRPALPRWLNKATILIAMAAGLGTLSWLTIRFTGRSTGEQLVASSIPLTTYPGSETQPSFSPDGNQVAFSWNGPGQDNYDIYVKMIGVEKPLRLTTDPAVDGWPAWSPDGRSIAFIRAHPDGEGEVRLIPAIGGPERELTRGVSSVPSWSPDSRWLTISDWDSPEHLSLSVFAVSVDTGERRKLTSPGPGFYDYCGTFSPDGRHLALSRYYGGSADGLYVMALSEDLRPRGEPEKIVSQTQFLRDLAWTPDGQEIVYVRARPTSGELWRVSLAGSRTPRRVEPGENRAAGGLSVSRRGDRLVYGRNSADIDIWRLPLSASGNASHRGARFISSTSEDLAPQYSPDGSRIAFISERSGHYEVWVSDSDGTNPVQLTSMGAHQTGSPSWSPDGTLVLFDSTAEGNFEVYSIDARGGKPRRLTNHPASDAVASFSRDGRWIYFESNRSGRNGIWKMPAAGGDAVQVTRNIGHGAKESPDGQYLYFTSRRSPADEVFILQRMPVAGGEAERIAEYPWLNAFAVTASGVYIGRKDSIELLDLSTKKTTKLAEVSGGLNWYFSVSPDERYLLYALTERKGSDLLLVENFH